MRDDGSARRSPPAALQRVDDVEEGEGSEAGRGFVALAYAFEDMVAAGPFRVVVGADFPAAAAAGAPGVDLPPRDGHFVDIEQKRVLPAAAAAVGEDPEGFRILLHGLQEDAQGRLSSRPFVATAAAFGEE